MLLLATAGGGVAALPIVRDAPEISFCNTTADVFQIRQLTLNPDEIKSGEDVMLTAQGFLSEPLTTGAKMEVHVKLGPIPVLHKVYDACDEMKGSKYPCPLAQGETTLAIPLHVSKIPIHGKVTATAAVTTADGKEVMCIEIKALV